MQTILIHIMYFALINLLMVLTGYLILKKQLIALSWLMLILGVAIVNLIFATYHPILRMLAIIATTFTGMKVIAVTESYRGKPLTLTFKQWAVYAIGWMGMRAQPFETLGQPALSGAWPMIRFGISRVVAGGGLIALAHLLMQLNLNADLIHVLVSLLLLVGFSLMLHFGLLSISAGSWRLSGVNTYLLFRQPIKATSLTEFWSKRWNIAFSEMTSVAIFRPVKKWGGSATALMAAFIFSGLLHELALSVPVNGGYGLPTLYFIIQGAVVLAEKAMTLNKIRMLQHLSTAGYGHFFG